MLFLTDCIVLHHWLIAQIGILVQNRFFLWLTKLQNSSYKCINYVLLNIYVWFVAQYRKPSDLSNPFKISNMITRIMYFIEYSTNYLLKMDINIMFWSSFVIAQILYLLTKTIDNSKHINVALKYFYKSRETTRFWTKPMDIIRHYNGSALLSNIVLS